MPPSIKQLACTAFLVLPAALPPETTPRKSHLRASSAPLPAPAAPGLPPAAPLGLWSAAAPRAGQSTPHKHGSAPLQAGRQRGRRGRRAGQVGQFSEQQAGMGGASALQLGAQLPVQQGSRWQRRQGRWLGWVVDPWAHRCPRRRAGHPGGALQAGGSVLAGKPPAGEAPPPAAQWPAPCRQKKTRETVQTEIELQSVVSGAHGGTGEGPNSCMQLSRPANPRGSTAHPAVMFQPT